jgi:hypothetical protein
MYSAFICGGNWNNGVHAGARAVNTNNYPWNVNSNIGSRLACDNKVASSNTKAPFCGAQTRLLYGASCSGKPMASIKTVYQIAALVGNSVVGKTMLAAFPREGSSFCKAEVSCN